ncbi:hypothetical protein DY000_02062986 [Brassica cretica]|uniref:MFS transporter n=1 Tax=Brassica cretica TaxID=69181 RepID=A0ABQ7AV29_BRACR|nr:hypothetical protein DY000_02062986 [Brassica cretica]
MRQGEHRDGEAAGPADYLEHRVERVDPEERWRTSFCCSSVIVLCGAMIDLFD